MKKYFLFLAIPFCLLAGCSKKDSTINAVQTGLYDSIIYSESAIQKNEIVYGTRANFRNLQYTSDITKQAEISTPNLSLKMDIYLPPNAGNTKKQPLLIMIHGGGFSAGDKNAWALEAYTYARSGYICASLNYRLTQSGGNQNAAFRLFAVQCAVEDVQNGIRFLKSNASRYFIDTSRIVVFGGSAGGVLSLLNAVEYDTQTGINDWPGMSSKSNGSVATGASLINDDLANQPGLFNFNADDSPVLMFHAKEYDSGDGGYTWTENALPTQQAIITSGNTCTLVPQPNMTHTVNLSLRGEYWQYLKPFLWEKLRIPALL